ncbi:hypothetical protein CQW23_32851 [Capsicum baccatum]|uniref:Aminotransferase-like plant mobile domain-containing protein n=1 Tax=Capsicum baccatum TaxID=33114 RepID=A0A2G2V3J2_CAPBA|nr:hypothetical protein CQW23_32851 [Capsicum baccatum]
MTLEGEYRHIPGYWEWTEGILGRSQDTFSKLGAPRQLLLTFVGEVSISLWDLHILGGLPTQGILNEEVVPEAKKLTGLDTKKVRYISQTYEYLFVAFHNLRDASQEVSFRDWITFWYKKPSKYDPALPRQEKKASRPELTHNPSGVLPDTLRWSHAEEKNIPRIMKNEICTGSLDKGLIFWRIRTLSRSSLRETFPSIAPNVGEFFGTDYQTWCKKTHGDFFGHHLQTLMDIAGSTTVVYLGNSDKVPTNEDLITDVPPSSNAKFPNQHANKRSHTPPAVYEGKTPTQTTHVSKRLSQDESKSSSIDHCWKRVKVNFDDAKGISPPAIEIHDDTDNPLRTISALARRYGSHDSDESVSGPDLIEPPFTVKIREGRISVSCNKIKATLDSDICKPLLVVMSVLDGKKVILDTQENYISSLRTIIQGKLSKCDVDCASSLEDEVQKAKNEAKEANLESFIAAKEFDASFDADLSNGVDQKKERLEAMRQDLINYKLCLD